MLYLPKFCGKVITLFHLNEYGNTVMMMDMTSKSLKGKLTEWVRQGISPQRLALTLSLGFAIGCIPVFGVTTAMCVAVALTLRLNLPVIQAANWAAMPLQMALLVPFVRMGRRLFSSGPALETASLSHRSVLSLIAQLGGLTAHAVLSWLLVAVPMVLLLTALLTLVLRRVPALAMAPSGD